MKASALARTALVASLCAWLTACGSGTHPSSSIASTTAPPAGAAHVAQFSACTAAVRRAASNALAGLSFAATVYAASDGSQGCRLKTVRRGGARVGIDIRVDTSPQPFARLDREQIETEQNVVWSHSGSVPEPVDGIGEAAFWFPGQSRLAATDGRKLVSVVVTGTPRARRLAVSKVVGRAALAEG